MTQTAPTDSLSAARDLWITLLAVGVLSILAGLVIVVWPDVSLTTLAVITGIFLVVDGVLAVVRAFRLRDDQGVALLALLGTLGLIAGLILVKHPFSTLVVFVIVLGAWFVVVGVTRLVLAFADAEGRSAGLLIGALEIGAGVVLLAWPDLSLKAAAVLAGVVLIVRGVALIYGAWRIRGATRTVRAAMPA